jgi:hypothetical protein
MTLAELHGKLSPENADACHDRLEDLLTSDVFGTMRYAGGSLGFLDWLHTAEPPPFSAAETPPMRDLLPGSEFQAVSFAFWPKLANARELDVALFIDYTTGSPVLVLVEAKYLSGTSDFAAPESGDDYGRTGNQLADQILGLVGLRPTDVQAWFGLPAPPLEFRRAHLFVTAHTLLPVPDYDAAFARLGRRWPVPAYWLSWTSLARHLELHRHHQDPGRAALIEDLIRLLERKGLVPYRGLGLEPCAAFAVLPRFWRDAWFKLAPVALTVGPEFWLKPSPAAGAAWHE